MTIHDAQSIKKILLAGGSDMDLQFSTIYQYRGTDGQLAYALFTDTKYDDIYQSPYVDHRSVSCFFELGEVTQAGRNFILALGVKG